MSDWKNKLEEEYRTRRQNEQAEIQRRSEHDQFINAHGLNAWKELGAKLDDACQHLRSHVNATFVLMMGDDGYIISGGIKPLDISFDNPTKIIAWQLRGTMDRGTLKPDRRGNELVYRNNDQILSVEDAATFLIRKLF